MTVQPITITIDNRVRLISAVLAATDWPDREQDRKRHRAHVHARYTGKCVEEFVDHPAVQTLQSLLDYGTPLDAIYAFALSLSWPELQPLARSNRIPVQWADELRDFLVSSDLEAVWEESEDAWTLAHDEIGKVLQDIDFHSFFAPFVGEIREDLIVMPNVSYPTDVEVGIRHDGQLFCLIPPRIAWGDNEPWPFDEDHAHIVRGAISQYARLLMEMYLRQNAVTIAPATSTPLPVNDNFRARYPTWGDQFTALFVSAAVAIFLEQTFGKPEAEAYILMENKLNGLKLLPSVVNVLQRYQEEYDQGTYSELAEYMPNFGKTLSVVKRA